MITIEFEKTDGTYTLKDAIVLPDDHGLTDVEIEAIKQKRFDDWVAIVTAPQPEVELDEHGNPIELVEEVIQDGE